MFGRIYQWGHLGLKVSSQESFEYKFNFCDRLSIPYWVSFGCIALSGGFFKISLIYWIYWHKVGYKVSCCRFRVYRVRAAFPLPSAIPSIGSLPFSVFLLLSLSVGLNFSGNRPFFTHFLLLLCFPFHWLPLSSLTLAFFPLLCFGCFSVFRF